MAKKKKHSGGSAQQNAKAIREYLAGKRNKAGRKKKDK